MEVKKLKKYIFVSSLLLCFAGCKSTSDKVIINRLADGRFGYEIRFHGKMFIRQSSIPAVNSNIGFITRNDAKKTGRLVLQKLQKTPADFPDVTIRELDSLKIQY